MATIVVSADRVITACDDKLKSIWKARENNVNRLLDRLFRKSITILGITIRKGIYTREQALAYIESDGMYWSREYMVYENARYAHTLFEERIKKLMYLARSGDPVTLDQDDCANLAPYL